MKSTVEVVLLLSLLSYETIEGKQSCHGNLNEAPFRVDLMLSNENSTVTRSCSGTVITDRSILTSAQCLRNMTTVTVSQFSESLDLNSTNASLIIHPDYTDSIFSDVGLIRLKVPITNVTAVELPTVSDAQQNITGRQLCSCGDVNRIISRCDCDTAYGGNGFIKESMFCVNRTEVVRAAACSDSLGKGLIVKIDGRCVVVGVLSKIECKLPRIYTKISGLLAFIRLYSLL